MRTLRIKASGTLVLPEPLMDEVVSSEINGGQKVLEKIRSGVLSSFSLSGDQAVVSFDLSGNRLKTIVNLSGSEFSSLIITGFRIIMEISIRIMQEILTEREDFARILSISDIHVLEIT